MWGNLSHIKCNVFLNLTKWLCVPYRSKGVFVSKRKRTTLTSQHEQSKSYDVWNVYALFSQSNWMLQIYYCSRPSEDSLKLKGH